MACLNEGSVMMGGLTGWSNVDVDVVEEVNLRLAIWVTQVLFTVYLGGGGLSCRKGDFPFREVESGGGIVDSCSGLRCPGAVGLSAPTPVSGQAFNNREVGRP